MPEKRRAIALGQAGQGLRIGQHRLQLNGLLAKGLAQRLAHGLFGDEA
jgi:hypothetical protein